MNTIEAFEKDIILQKNFITKFKLQKPLSNRLKTQVIFCGTGDSFVAALLAEAFSNFLVRAFDPLDIIKNKNITLNKKIFFVSISGNTASNIKLARMVKQSVAITANPNSKLGMSTSQTISLSYPSSGIFTAGSIGFLASALTCISLVTKFSLKKIEILFLDAQKESKKIKLSGKIFVLGNMYTFPISMYFVAKLYEVLGINAQYERIEQFLHTGLFSAKSGDTVIIFDVNSNYNTKLKKTLIKAGLRVIHTAPNTRNKIKQICYYIFFSQFISLFHAKRVNQKQCYFINAKKLRDASSEMIY